MFSIHCTECDSSQGEGVVILKEDNKSRKISPDTTISQDITTTFYCGNCCLEETVETGVLPETKATHFESRCSSAEKSMEIQVDDEEISFQSVDEQLAENAYYTSDGVRGTSKVHHIHIHAQNPPTISKGKHRVQIGDYVDHEMILGGVRYHDENNRTLKFFRALDDDVMEPLDRETNHAADLKAERF